MLEKKGLFQNAKFPVSERLAQRGFYLPSGMALKEEQMCDTVNAVKKVLLGEIPKSTQTFTMFYIPEKTLEKELDFSKVL